MDTLYLDTPTAQGSTSVNVHPLVLLSILDHHIRRDASQDRVIGALLGTVGPGGVVEVTDAFGVHHSLRVGDEVRFSYGCGGDARFLPPLPQLQPRARERKRAPPPSRHPPNTNARNPAPPFALPPCRCGCGWAR